MDISWWLRRRWQLALFRPCLRTRTSVTLDRLPPLCNGRPALRSPLLHRRARLHEESGGDETTRDGQAEALVGKT